MKRCKVAGVCFLGSLVGFGLSPSARAEPLNRVVAVVNNEVITLHEVNKKIKEVTGSTPEDIMMKRGDRALPAVQRQVVELLIDERITDAKIRELGIKITQKQIDEAVETVKRENQLTEEGLRDRLRREGLSWERYRDKLKKELERQQLIHSEVRSKILISEDRIKRYYEEHKDRYTTDAKVRLAGIFLVSKNPKDEKEMQSIIRRGEEMLKSLQNGESFGDLARKNSHGPGADEGGDLGVFSTSRLEPELRKIVEALAPGGVSDLIVRSNGVQILKLISKEGGIGKPLEEVRDAIFSALYREEVNDRYATWLRELREKSYTQILF
ncbi:MAG: SurA N-terminal domain-containing protein [Thermodesulfobacteriota bacterium]